MNVTISLSSEESPVWDETTFPWICIFCVSGSDNTVNLAIAEFNAETGS